MIVELLQVFAAISLVIGLLILAFSIYNAEALNAVRNTGTLKRQVNIFTGVYDFKYGTASINTVDPTASSYKQLDYSVNQKSGAEFTYSFWLYLDGTNATKVLYNNEIDSKPGGGVYVRQKNYTTDEGLIKSTDNIAGTIPSYGDNLTTPPTPEANLALFEQPLVLLVRGESIARKYKGLCYNESATADTPYQVKADVLVKCPLIKLEKGGDVLSVEFNTSLNPDMIIENSQKTCGFRNADYEMMNSYKVAVKNIRKRTELAKKWFLVTVVLQDTYPNDPIQLRNKIRARIYINNNLELDRYIDSSFAYSSGNDNSLKINNGNLYIAPQITDNTTNSIQYSKKVTSTSEVLMADLNYFNYAITADQVAGLYQAGINKKIITNISTGTDPIQLSQEQQMLNSMSLPSKTPYTVELGTSA